MRRFLMTAVSVCLAAMFMTVPVFGEVSLYQEALKAYEDQKMPEWERMPEIPEFDTMPSRSYTSVTPKDLQGRWVNRYREGGVDFTEVLTINGDRASIETWQDGVKKGVWNGEGTYSIEDRSDRKVCPAFRITDDSGDNVCTIYIRWVKDGEFYDGGSLCKWYREEPEDLRDQYLYDTVTLEKLQGVWYSEYEDGAGIYQDVLNVEGNRASIFETVAGVISDTWNGEGPCEIQLAECGGIRFSAEDPTGWGYTNAGSMQQFYRLYHELVSAFLDSPVLQGFCYTQLTDVMQEENGLLNMEHEPKVDCAVIRAINEGKWTPEEAV